MSTHGPNEPWDGKYSCCSCDYGEQDVCPSCETSLCNDCGYMDVIGCEPCDHCIRDWPEDEVYPTAELALRAALVMDSKRTTYAIVEARGGWDVTPVRHVVRCGERLLSVCPCGAIADGADPECVSCRLQASLRRPIPALEKVRTDGSLGGEITDGGPGDCTGTGAPSPHKAPTSNRGGAS